MRRDAELTRRNAYATEIDADFRREDADLTRYDADMTRWKGDVRRAGGRNALSFGQYQARAARTTAKAKMISTGISTGGRLLSQGASLSEGFR